MSISKTILIGNLGGDPEVRYMPNGNAVANMTVATSEKWRDKTSGEQREKTEWHRVVIFGKLAEIAGQYLQKGSKVYIEGQNETREWEKDGVKRYTTEVVVKMGGQMRMLDGARGQQEQQQGQQQGKQYNQQSGQQYNQQGGQQRAQQPQGQQRNQGAGMQQQGQQQQQQGGGDNEFDDDIPF